MSIKELKEGIEKGEVLFGIRQALKGNNSNIFVCKNTRPETLKKLEDSKKEYSFLKTKAEVKKDLNLDFESEVFSISLKQSKKKK